jgi:hypothetical protein
MPDVHTDMMGEGSDILSLINFNTLILIVFNDQQHVGCFEILSRSEIHDHAVKPVIF